MQPIIIGYATGGFKFILFCFANSLPQIQWFKFDSKFNVDIQELQEWALCTTFPVKV